MKTLIVYSSKYGSVEKCVNIISEKINGEVKVINISKEKVTNLNEFQNILIGGSIYMGRIQKKVSDFCLSNLDYLINKKVGLFICCMSENETALSQLNSVYPKKLLEAAIVKDYFGGGFNFTKMNFFERFIVKKIAKVDKDTSYINEDKISNFVDIINS